MDETTDKYGELVATLYTRTEKLRQRASECRKEALKYRDEVGKKDDYWHCMGKYECFLEAVAIMKGKM